MRNSPISINVLVEQKVTSKNLIIYLGFLIYISSIFWSTFNLEPTFKTFLAWYWNIWRSFITCVQTKCKGNIWNIWKYFKTVCLVFKDERIENEMQSLSLLVLFGCTAIFFYVRCGPLFAVFHPVTQPFWYDKPCYKNIVFCVCIWSSLLTFVRHLGPSWDHMVSSSATESCKAWIPDLHQTGEKLNPRSGTEGFVHQWGVSQAQAALVLWQITPRNSCHFQLCATSGNQKSCKNKNRVTCCIRERKGKKASIVSSCVQHPHAVPWFSW